MDPAASKNLYRRLTDLRLYLNSNFGFGLSTSLPTLHIAQSLCPRPKPQSRSRVNSHLTNNAQGRTAPCCQKTQDRASPKQQPHSSATSPRTEH